MCEGLGTGNDKIKSVAVGKFMLSVLTEWYYVNYIRMISVATQNPYKEGTIILPISVVP